MTDTIETTENVFEALDLPYHAKAVEIVSRECCRNCKTVGDTCDCETEGGIRIAYPISGVDLVSAIAAALEAERLEERERILTALSGEIQSVTLGPEMIAKGMTEDDAISLLNQGMIIARGCVRVDGPGTFEESGATVNVTELVAAIRSRETDNA